MCGICHLYVVDSGAHALPSTWIAFDYPKAHGMRCHSRVYYTWMVKHTAVKRISLPSYLVWFLNCRINMQCLLLVLHNVPISPTQVYETIDKWVPSVLDWVKQDCCWFGETKYKGTITCVIELMYSVIWLGREGYYLWLLISILSGHMHVILWFVLMWSRLSYKGVLGHD